MARNQKKVVLLIVDGTSDAISFEMFFSEIKSDKNIKFQCVRGCVATKLGVTPQNCTDYIKDQIEEFINTNPYKIRISDIIEIVHIVDLDGTYINENNIEEDKSIPYIIYKENKIITKSKYETSKRSKTKASVLDRLVRSKNIKMDKKTIPYSIYFCSKNLEHVLHNDTRSGLTLKEKTRLAYKFQKQYKGNTDEFIKFMSEGEFAVPGNYYETWSFVKVGNRSLSRYSNLHLYLNE